MQIRHLDLNTFTAADLARRKPWMVAAVIVLLLALGLYAASPVILTSLGERLIHADMLERADVMIVLAPGLDRLIEAAEVYRQGYAPLILLTRERREPAEQLLIDRGIVESGEDWRRKVLHALGVPLEAVSILEHQAESTADEARDFAGWARGYRVRSVIVVTSPLHTARSRLTFLRALENLSVKVMMRPSGMSRFRSDSWWRSRDTLRDGVLEWQKLVYYWIVELYRIDPIAES